MQLILSKTEDSDNVIGKVLTEPLTLNVTLRGDFDLANPTFTLSGTGLGVYNYCTLVELDRSYFIRTKEHIGSSAIRLECECDYLETYKTQILSANCKFKKVLEVGDYGDLDLDSSGRIIVQDYVASVELEPSEDAILSVLNGGNINE